MRGGGVTAYRSLLARPTAFQHLEVLQWGRAAVGCPWSGVVEFADLEIFEDSRGEGRSASNEACNTRVDANRATYAAWRLRRAGPTLPTRATLSEVTFCFSAIQRCR